MTIETQSSDRSGWPSGPWDAEPDRDQWIDAATGLHCLAVRHPRDGHWCGYVALPLGHPWRDGGADDADVHGGISYGPSPCEGNVCHVVEGNDDVRWVGFDCAHYLDGSPTWRTGGIYRDLAFVRSECTSLAAQAAAKAGE